MATINESMVESAALDWPAIMAFSVAGWMADPVAALSYPALPEG